MENIAFVGGVIAGFLFGTIMAVRAWFGREKKGAYNKLREKDALALKSKGYLVLSPPGDTQDFVFGPPEDSVRCGGAYFGMTIDAHRHVDTYKGLNYESFKGGVIGLEDCIRLKNHLEEHIKLMGKGSTPIT